MKKCMSITEEPKMKTKLFSKKMLRSKKGIEVWISWVLLMGFVAALSMMMYDFMRDYTKDRAADITRVSSNTAECELVAISIDSVCKHTTTSPIYLNITIANRLNINVDQLMFRTFDSSNMFLNTSQLNISTKVLTLKPQQSKLITLNISDTTVNTLQVIPVAYDAEHDLTIVCRNRMVEATPIKEC